MRHAPATVLVLLAVLVLGAWFAPDVMLTLFASVLTAVAIRAAAVPLAARLDISETLAVVLVMLTLFAVVGILAALGAASLLEQGRQVSRDLPRALEQVDEILADFPGREWIERVFRPATPSPDRLSEIAVAAVTYLLGALTNLVLILLLAVFLASDPASYRAGAVSLLSPALRPRAVAVLDAMHEVLRGWLLGQLFAMGVSGILTFVGLWALGVPAAALLAILTALFGFIPYVGPFLGLIPAALIALVADPWLVPWVVGLFLLVQNIEGYVLTPLVQERTAHVPPAVLLGAQVLFGTGMGVLGVLLAAPVAAAVVAAARVAYVQGWVEAEQRPPG